jgi:hypothetical protein
MAHEPAHLQGSDADRSCRPVNPRAAYERTPRAPADEFERRLLSQLLPRRYSLYSDLPGSVLLKHASRHPHLQLYRDRTTWWQHLGWIFFVAFLRLFGLVSVMLFFCALLPLTHSGFQSALMGALFIGTLLSLFYMVRDQHERGHWGVDSRIWIHAVRRKLVAEVVTTGGTTRRLQRVLLMDDLVLRGWTEEREDETTTWYEVHLSLCHRDPALAAGNPPALTELVGLRDARGLEHQREVDELGEGLSTRWNLPYVRDF